MNKVILLMWLGDVFSNISLVGVVTLIGLMLMLVCIGCIAVSDSGELGFPPLFRRGIYTALSVLVIAVLLPNKSTMYAAAALETGAVIAKTPTGEKIDKTLNAVMDKIIKEAEKK